MINRFALSFVCIELDRNVRFGVMLFHILPPCCLYRVYTTVIYKHNVCTRVCVCVCAAFSEKVYV